MRFLWPLAVVAIAPPDQVPDTPAGTPPPAVAVITTRLAGVMPSYGFNGRVVAEDKIDLRARVAGFLQKRLFEEGADVKVGDLLFAIEKDQYQAVVDQPQAGLASTEANKATTAVQLKRGEELASPQQTERPA
jgi:membrane fusion protein (multidrug efflux system)